MAKSEFQYSRPFKVTDEMKKSFEEKGYILVRGLIEKDELENVRKIVENNSEFHDNAFVLLGGEVYHYHSKFTMKDARTGGRFVWHQDYGYWYQNGILKPDMMSVFIPIDKCQKSNGCLQILEGSHKCGRIDHGREGGQTGANLERLELIKSQFPHLYVEMDAGDALFFHCNVLHTSSANQSDDRRWVFIACYNMASNNPAVEHHFPRYNKLDIVDDEALRECTNFTDLTGKKFMNPTDNKTIVASRA